MKKTRIFSLIAIAALLFTLVPAASAGGPPGNWASGISCQNLSTTTAANITLYYYEEDNSTYVLMYADPTSIPPSGFRGYYTPNVANLPDGFLGSVVVSSNTEMACNVNTDTTSAGTQADPLRKGTSAGFNSGQVSKTMYAPQVEKAFYGYNSYISVQNTGGSPTNVTITYKDRYGNDVPAATESKTIAGNTNHIFYQADNTGLPADYVGGAKISSDTNPVAVTVEFYASGADFKSSQLHSYNGFSTGADRLLVPRYVFDYYGYNSGLTVQNVGSSATTITITFTDVAGNPPYIYNSGTIPAGASLALYLPDVPALAPMKTLPLSQSYGNAIVQAATGGQIVAIVNQDNRGGVSKGYVVPDRRAGQGGTYNAFLNGTQTFKVFFPQVPDKAGGIYSGGLAFSNTTASVGTCTVTWSSWQSNPPVVQSNLPMPAYGTISLYAPNITGLTDGFNASATAECNVQIIGIGNFAADPQVSSARYGDTFSEYNGLNQ